MSRAKIMNRLSMIKKIDFTAYNNSEIFDISQEFLKRSISNKNSEDRIIHVFALVAEAIRRTLHIIPCDAQIQAALAMAEGHIIELPTGEGKTIVAVFVAYLNALEMKGVHVLTFNDFLAKRDTLWMRPIYELLGVSVDYISEAKTNKDRKSAYQADITYGTVKEIGYDYLRSFLMYDADSITQRPFHTAIIDEADSIMIDHARIPLIVASDHTYEVNIDKRLDETISGFEENIHYKIYRYAKTIYLTEEGYDLLEKEMEVNLFAADSIELLSKINLVLKARFLLHKDKNYIVKDDHILIIDEFTGRIMKDCKWPDGIQAAIELKENLPVNAAESVMNRVTIQSFLCLYPKLCGMTGTALSSASEFQTFYHKKVVAIPPDKPCIRIDHPDSVFISKTEKNKAIIKKVLDIHKTGRPILIGTASVRESEELALTLENEIPGIQVLNAKNDEEEAAIIENAGKLHAVTISTNMAGRGVDIRLGGIHAENYEKIVSLGGLYIIGTNRHDSIRIDHQLRGRSGRQGDPGESVFYISLEDDIFKKHDIRKSIPKGIINCSCDELHRSKKINKLIRHIQKVMEGESLDAKISLSKYSAIYEKQRRIVHQARENVLYESKTLVDVNHMFSDALRNMIPKQDLMSVLKSISLYSINECWADHLLYVDQALDEVQVIGKSTSDPFDFYNRKIIEIFQNFDNNVQMNITAICKSIIVEDGRVALWKMGIHGPVSTKTYMLLDGSEELNLVNELAAVSNPITALYFMFYLAFKNSKKGLEEKQ